MDLNPAEKKWARYLTGLLEKVSTQQCELVTPFADPRQQEIAQHLSRDYPACDLVFAGGMATAERARIQILPHNHTPKEKNPVTPLLIEGSFPADTLSHRDFLGAILGLGIKREMVGDIICKGTAALVFIIPDLADYVVQHLKQVGRFTVDVTVPGQIPQAFVRGEGRIKEIRGTVASLRIDAVAGLGFGLSRSRITPLVKGEQVKLNHRAINQPSRTVKEGDLISLTGRGRVEVVEILGETRKGRISLKLRRQL